MDHFEDTWIKIENSEIPNIFLINNFEDRQILIIINNETFLYNHTYLFNLSSICYWCIILTTFLICYCPI